MSGYSYSFHRFDDRDAFLQTCLDAGFQFYEGIPCPNEGDAIDDIGILVEQPFPNENLIIDENGILINQESDPPVVLPGYHVNMAWRNEMNPAFAASEVSPQNPRRLWF